MIFIIFSHDSRYSAVGYLSGAGCRNSNAPAAEIWADRRQKAEKTFPLLRKVFFLYLIA